MALMAYLQLSGQRTGNIKGSVTQKGREDQIAVIAVSHEIVSPRDPQSGLPTGQRQHKPLVITKEIDVSSPLLEQVLINNENLTTVTLRFWQPQVGGAVGGGGTEKQSYTIALTNANIASIRTEMLNIRYPENVRHEVREHITLTYERIVWTWTDGGITAEDNWEARAK